MTDTEATASDAGFTVRDRRRFSGGDEEDPSASSSGEAESASSKPEPSPTDSAATTSAATDPGDSTDKAAGEGVSDEDTNTGDGPSKGQDAAEDAGAFGGDDSVGDDPSDGAADENFAMPEFSTESVLQFTMATLSQQAWCDLGLIASRSTGKVVPKLPEARLAIDALSALFPVISPRLDDSSRREMQTLISNLKLNYVEQSKRQNS